MAKARRVAKRYCTKSPSKSGLWYKWYLLKKGLDESAVAQKLSEWQAGQEAKITRNSERKQRRKATKKAKKAAETAPAAAAPSTQPAEASGTPPAA